MSVVAIPEVREMVLVAQRYVYGEATVVELYGASCSCADWSRRFGAHASIFELASKWSQLADQCWNELGFYEKRFPDSELRQVIQKDLGELS